MVALTANEKLRDALVRRQAYLSKYEQGLKNKFIDLLDKTEADVRSQIERTMTALGEGATWDTATHSRLNVLAQTLAQLRGKGFDSASEMMDANMTALAQNEADYIDSAITHVSPVQVDTTLPDATQLAQIIASVPMQGRLMSDWADGLAKDDVDRIMDSIRVRMAQGSTTDQIVRDVLGTSQLDGADGALQLSRNNAASIVQTAVATVSGEARQAYYEANNDVISEEVWVATLDPSTCEVCGALDGERFPVGEGDQPPEHWNCRCVRVPALDGDALGDRPSVAATEDMLDGLNPEERAAKISELVGTVPASMTYADWLASQSPEFQDEILGPARGAMFRDGMDLKQFVANGDTLTLDELKNIHPSGERILQEEAASAQVADYAAGLKASGEEESNLIQKQWISDSPIHTIDDLYAHAAENDVLLRDLGKTIADDLDHGMQFEPGPIKKAERVLEKMEQGKPAAGITDVVRATEKVTTPEQADAVVRELSKSVEVTDEGWRRTEAGYFDRPLKIRFDNGQIGEVLLGPKELFDAKGPGGGHQLYEDWRKLSKDNPLRDGLRRQMESLYQTARDSLSPEWQSFLDERLPAPGLAGGSDTTGNVARGIERDAAEKIATKVSDDLSFDVSRVDISDESKTFVLNGETLNYAGSAQIMVWDEAEQKWVYKAGDITIYTPHVNEKSMPGVLAHEIEHVKFQTVFDMYQQEYAVLRDMMHDDDFWFDASSVRKGVAGIMRPSGELTDAAKTRWPVYAKMWEFLDGTPWEEFAKADGVSDYSLKYWNQFANDSRSDLLFTAKHETLAEIARIKYETGKFPKNFFHKYDPKATSHRQMFAISNFQKEAPSKLWRDFYRAVDKIYEDFVA